MLTTATRRAGSLVNGLREHKKPRWAHVGHEVGTLSLEGTPIDEKPDALVEFIENRSTPATPAPKVEDSTHTDRMPEDIKGTREAEQQQWFVGAIDQGTTSTRFLIFNTEGEPVANHQLEFENLYPQSGWHEHDPMVLYQTSLDCIEGAMKQFEKKGFTAKNIRSIGVTNQRETIVVWDKNTGKPLYNTIAWPDTRTTNLVRELKECPGADDLLEACGQPLSTYPSSVKLMWLIKNVPEVKQAYDDERLAFGTVDSWLIYKLNGGADAKKPIHVTDPSNASRTMFMNLRSMKYDEKLLSFFDIDPTKCAFPEIVPSSDATAFGKIAMGPLKDTTIAGCIGDQSSALVGQTGFKPGQAKATYGTGAFLLYNVGNEPVISNAGLMSTVAYDFGKGGAVYALEGSVAVAGSGVKFLINNMDFFHDSKAIDDVAGSVPDNGGVVFVTAFSGLFAPYWIDDAKGTIFGMTQHTKKGHIARATLEATCYQTKAILDAMEKDSGKKLQILAVDGGLSNSDLCMQTQADVTGIPVDRPAMRETTALGAAIAAGFATGVWAGQEELENVNRKDRKVFEPSITKDQSAKMFKRWEQAVEMSRGWTQDE